MLSRPPWREEFWTVTAVLLIMLLGGAVSGTAYWPVALSIVGYLGWNLYHLILLFKWLDQPKTQLPDNTPGLWGYLYYRLQIKQRNEKNRKKQVKRLLKEFSASAKALPDATLVLNERFEIQWVNEAATQLLHIHRNDSGQKIVDLLRHPKFHKYLSKASFKKPLEFSPPANPDRTLLLRIVPYGRQQYLLLARDITERQRLEQMRRDFIANASHELKTPLTVLQGSLDQLQAIEITGNSVAKPLEWMRRQSSRMQRILEDLLTLARLEGGPLHEEIAGIILPGKIINTICKDAQALSEQLGGHAFDIEADDALAIFGDEAHMQTALTNLIMNAVHYTPPGGTITIRWERHASGARFMVRDTGPGIPAQHLSRLTERFYRVDVGRSRETGGTGLGLAIVKHVIEPYQTILDIQSTPGSGSSFAFTIPNQFIAPEAQAS